MVKSGHMTSIRHLTYDAPTPSMGDVEVMSFEYLRGLDQGRTQRGDFHVIALVTAGHGAVSIDFTRSSLNPRTVVWLAPGAVHHWIDITDVRGELALFTPTAPATRRTQRLAATPNRVALWTARSKDWPYITAAMDHLRLEANATAPPDQMAGILVSGLISRIAMPHGHADHPDDLFHRFSSNVETDFRNHHNTLYYADRLGYSARTLSRAVHGATGRTAKAYIVERILLEAKRTLAHDGLTAAQCAMRLGFRDASSFSSFFRRGVGQTPGAWQRRNRGQVRDRPGDA